MADSDPYGRLFAAAALEKPRIAIGRLGFVREAARMGAVEINRLMMSYDS